MKIDENDRKKGIGLVLGQKRTSQCGSND